MSVSNPSLNVLKKNDGASKVGTSTGQTVQELFDIQDTRIDNLVLMDTEGSAAAIDSLNLDVIALENGFTSLGSQVTGLSNSLSTVQTELDAVETATTANSNANTALESRVEDTENGLTALSSSVTTLQTGIDDNSASITSILESSAGDSARWEIKTNVNELVGGVGFYNDGLTTKFVIDADNIIYGGVVTGALIRSSESGSRVEIVEELNEINVFWDDLNGVQKNLVLGTNGEGTYGDYAIQVGHTNYEGFGISSINSSTKTAGYFQSEGGGSFYPTLNVVNNGNNQFDRGVQSIARTSFYAAATGLGSVGVSSGATSDGYDFYARGSGTNYGPFTGAHDAVINKNAVLPVSGDIVKSIGICCRSSVSNVLAEIELQNTSESKNSFGVFVYSIDLAQENEVSSMSNLTDTEYLNIRNSHYKAAINGVGEGQINVCDEGGNIEIGDFITTSTVAGKGKQYSGSDMRVVVARALEPVDWSQEAGTQKQIACIYLCG